MFDHQHVQFVHNKIMTNKCRLSNCRKGINNFTTFSVNAHEIQRVIN